MGLLHSAGQAVKLLWNARDKAARVVTSLPAPAGPYKVGTVRMTWTDPARTGIYSEPGTPRRLPVQIWYPARPTGGEPVAPYLPQKGIMGLFSKTLGLPDIFAGMDDLDTAACVGAPFDPDAKTAPLILFSHGYSAFECQNTLQMQHLASFGYVVASMCHTYESFAACMDDGTVVPIGAERHKEVLAAQRASLPKGNADLTTPETMVYAIQHDPLMSEGVAVWVDDIVFVADRMAALAADKDSLFYKAYDPAAAGLFGHSYGGAASGQATLRDKRFTCFCNMDGGPYGLLSKQGTDAPGMVLTSETHIEAGYHPDNKNLLVVRVANAKHSDYTDFCYASPVLKTVDLVLGPISAEAQQRIMDDYLLAFFDTFLKGEKPSALLKGADSDPNVEVSMRSGWPYAK